jgi:hypothetical protein
VRLNAEEVFLSQDAEKSVSMYGRRDVAMLSIFAQQFEAI